MRTTTIFAETHTSERANHVAYRLVLLLSNPILNLIFLLLPITSNQSLTRQRLRFDLRVIALYKYFIDIDIDIDTLVAVNESKNSYNLVHQSVCIVTPPDFFVCLYLCFNVSKITRKRLDRFAWNFREGVEWPRDDLITFLVNSEKPRDAAIRSTGMGFVVLSHHSLFFIVSRGSKPNTWRQRPGL